MMLASIFGVGVKPFVWVIFSNKYGFTLFIVNKVSMPIYSIENPIMLVNEAMREDTGFSTQDIVGLLIAGAMAVLYFMSAEEELDWEALLGDDDDDEEE